MSITIQGGDRSMPQPAAAQAAVRVPPTDKPEAAAVPGSHAAPAKQARQQREQEVRDAVQRLNEQMSKQSRNLSFSVDEKASRTVITVKNATTGEVVRQIPDEVLLRVAHSIEEFKGLMLNEKT